MLKKSTWANESFIAPFHSVLSTNLHNAGIAENHIHIGYPLHREIYPSRSLRLGIHGLGLGAETPEKIEIENSGLEMVEMFNAIAADALGGVDLTGALTAAQAFQDAMNQMTTTSFGPLVPLVGPVLGTLEMYKAVYAAGGKHAKKWLKPFKKKKGFKAPDLDGDGLPDELPDIFGTYLKESLGSDVVFADGVQAFISFEADGASLRIDTELKLDGVVSSGRLTLDG